jgi:hypothetical protein
MTEQQRKGIEILNDLRTNKNGDGTPVISDDDYFFLLSFIIDRPQEVSVPTPFPVTLPAQPWQPPTIQPYYGQRWEVICKMQED